MILGLLLSAEGLGLRFQGLLIIKGGYFAIGGLRHSAK